MPRRYALGGLALAATLAAALVAGATACGGEKQAAKPKRSADRAPKVSVFATGLLNPRGLTFGADGSLYVAEAGLGGTRRTTRARCQQVLPPIGPYAGGMTGRISKISPSGERTTVADKLPSTQTSRTFGRIVYGVSDVEFLDGRLYALEGGAGCSHGVPEVPNGVFSVEPDGTWKVVADLGAFVKKNPVADPGPPRDYEPDGAWYSMVAADGALYTVEPQGGQVVRVTPDGRATRVVDISATHGHIRPTGITYHEGNLYVASFGTFPVKARTMKVFKITPDGDISVHAEGFTTVIALAFRCDRLYALELPPSLRLVELTPDGKLRTVLSAKQLKIPGGMTVGPDGDLYITDYSFFFRPPRGRILRVDFPDRC